ncbi:MAG: thioredoxin [Clostridia bacterium]|nr:thioredoxin [Clostridia bacterium]
MPEPKPAAQPEKRGKAQAVLIAAAVALIVLGIVNGSARDVLYKAIMICTECVGLG